LSKAGQLFRCPQTRVARRVPGRRACAQGLLIKAQVSVRDQPYCEVDDNKEALEEGDSASIITTLLR